MGSLFFKRSCQCGRQKQPLPKRSIEFRWRRHNVQKQLQFLQTQEGDHTLLLDALHLEARWGPPSSREQPKRLLNGSPGEKACLP